MHTHSDMHTTHSGMHKCIDTTRIHSGMHAHIHTTLRHARTYIFTPHTHVFTLHTQACTHTFTPHTHTPTQKYLKSRITYINMHVYFRPRTATELKLNKLQTKAEGRIQCGQKQ